MVFAVSIHDFLPVVNQWKHDRWTAGNASRVPDREVVPERYLRGLAAALRKSVEGVLLHLRPDRDMVLVRLPIAQVGWDAPHLNGLSMMLHYLRSLSLPLPPSQEYYSLSVIIHVPLYSAHRPALRTSTPTCARLT
jgi:hypothetical protein